MIVTPGPAPAGLFTFQLADARWPALIFRVRSCSGAAAAASSTNEGI